MGSPSRSTNWTGWNHRPEEEGITTLSFVLLPVCIIVGITALKKKGLRRFGDSFSRLAGQLESPP